MARDLGRDTDIGIPPAETQQVNVVLSQPITDALKEQLATKLADTNLILAANHKLLEFIWSGEVPLGTEE